MHMRFDPRALARGGASFDGVTAMYVTTDGEPGKTKVAAKTTYRICTR